MASVDAEPEVPVCRDFLRHACTRGTRCRFRHDSASGRGDQSTSGGHYDGCHPCFKTSVDGVDRQAATDDSGDVADYKDGDDVIVEINSPHTDVTDRRRCESVAPICRDHLRGACRRASTCKFRHVTLDQYTSEVHDIAVRRHHTATADCGTKKRRHWHERHSDDDDDDVVRCCCKTQDRLRIVQAENSSLRKRVADLRRKVAQLSSERKHGTHSDIEHAN